MQLPPPSEETDERIDLTDGEDQQDDHTVSDIKHGIIISVAFCDPYFACPVQTCDSMKLTSLEVAESCSKLALRCPSHTGNVAADSANQCLVAKFFIMTQHNQDEHIEGAVAFKPMIEKLFAVRGLSLRNIMDHDEVEKQVMYLIPMTITYKVSDAGVISTVKK